MKGRSLSTISATHYETSPDNKEANSLMGWYENYGKDISFVPIGNDYSENCRFIKNFG